VQRLAFSASKYAHIRAHFRAAVRKGWPRRLGVNRPGADARRDRLLEDYPTRPGFDRDEYPPAVGRGRGPGLERGSDPRGEGRGALRAQLREPLARRLARRQAAELLQRHPLPLRVRYQTHAGVVHFQPAQVVHISTGLDIRGVARDARRVVGAVREDLYPRAPHSQLNRARRMPHSGRSPSAARRAAPSPAAASSTTSG